MTSQSSPQAPSSRAAAGSDGSSTSIDTRRLASFASHVVKVCCGICSARKNGRKEDRNGLCLLCASPFQAAATSIYPKPSQRGITVRELEPITVEQVSRAYLHTPSLRPPPPGPGPGPKPPQLPIHLMGRSKEHPCKRQARIGASFPGRSSSRGASRKGRHLSLLRSSWCVRGLLEQAP